MFREVEREVVGMNLTHPPDGWKGAFCDKTSPDEIGRWICTREFLHDGPHRAGNGVWSWAAEWDDDRSTD